jgi:hypothetical protein
VKVSVTIMAHRDRAEAVYRLRDLLDHPARVAWDERPASPDPNRIWDNGRQAWELHDSFADYHLVLQDDAEPSPNLIAETERAVKALGRKGLLSLFTGNPRPNQVGLRAALDRHVEGEAWLWSHTLEWAVAVAVPVSVIPEMLIWCDQREGMSYHFRIARYFRDILGWRTFYPYPSLVDHRIELPSLIGRRHEGRASEVVENGSLDFGRKPEGFSLLIDPSLMRLVR